MQHQMLLIEHNIKTMRYGVVVAYDIIPSQHTPKKPVENKHQSTLLILEPTFELPTAASMSPM
jgi:hypothetical protein